MDTEELTRKINSPRVKPENKDKYAFLLNIFQENFVKLSNGFVIFRSTYLQKIYKKIEDSAQFYKQGQKIVYTEFLDW